MANANMSPPIEGCVFFLGPIYYIILYYAYAYGYAEGINCD